MAFKFNRSKNEPMSEINVTPFRRYVSFINNFYGNGSFINCRLRSIYQSQGGLLPDDQEPLTISINSKGEIYIQEHQVSYKKWFLNC